MPVAIIHLEGTFELYNEGAGLRILLKSGIGLGFGGVM